MASLKDIRRRIGSVKSTQKITGTMKLVDAAKFARASSAAKAARPYGAALDRLVSSVLLSSTGTLESPLLVARPEKKILIVIVATDRGLCGGLNTNLFKRVRLHVLEKTGAGVALDVMAWGRRAVLFSRKTKQAITDSREKVLDKPSYATVVELAKPLLDGFLTGKYDRIYVAYTKFRSALVQEPTVTQLLPVVVDPEAMKDVLPHGYIFEPNLPELIDSLLMKKVIGTLFRILLESKASEHGARMTAMDSATKNAKEVVKKLTLQYNRARQAAITKELIEIVSGAEALK